MEAHEWGGPAPPRGDQGTGTRGSPVGRRSPLVDVDREFRVADHPQVPDPGLARRKTPTTGKMASEQQAVPPLTWAGLRSIVHHAAELGSTLPGLRPELPGSSAPLSGEHVRPLQGTPASCLEVETGGGRKETFPDTMQEYSRMLSRPTPL